MKRDRHGKIIELIGQNALEPVSGNPGHGFS